MLKKKYLNKFNTMVLSYCHHVMLNKLCVWLEFLHIFGLDLVYITNLWLIWLALEMNQLRRVHGPEYV